MSDDLTEFWVHPTTVKAFAGAGADGDVYADPVTVTGFVDDANKLVMNAAGEQVVSSARVFFPAGTGDVPLRSLVTLPAVFGGRTSEVIAVSRHDSGAVGLPDHLEVALQ